jgi:hypothetical protein
MKNLPETKKQNVGSSKLTESQIWKIVIALNIATWCLIFIFDR